MPKKSISKTVGNVVRGTSNRITGVADGVFQTVGKVLGRTRDVAVGTVHVAKNVLTLDGKNLKKDVSGIGKSAFGAVKNVATGTVSTARAAIVGKEKRRRKSSKATKKK